MGTPNDGLDELNDMMELTMDTARTTITTDELRERLGLPAAPPRKPMARPPADLDNVVPIRPHLGESSLDALDVAPAVVPELPLLTAPDAVRGDSDDSDGLTGGVEAEASSELAQAVTTVSSKAVEAVLFELLHMVRAANAQRDDALSRLRQVAAENRRLLAERQQLTCLTSRWASHAREIEQWADEMQRYYEERVDGCEQHLMRTLHEKERAFEIADELAASTLWTRRFRRRTLADELSAMRDPQMHAESAR